MKPEIDVRSCLKQLDSVSKSAIAICSSDHDRILTLTEFLEPYCGNVSALSDWQDCKTGAAAASYDAVILDTSSGHGNAFEMAEFYRKHHAEIPVVFVCDGEDQTAISEIIGMELYDYVTYSDLGRLPHALNLSINRTRARKDVLISQSMKQSLLDASRSLIVVLNRDGIIIDCNRTMTESFMSSRKEMIGASVWDVINCDSTDNCVTIVEDVFRTGRSATIIYHIDGKSYDSAVWPVFDSDGNVKNVTVNAVDITEHNKTISELKTSEERYALAQKAANIGVWELNFATEDLYWSETIEPIFGLDKGDFEQTHDSFLKQVHPDDREFVEKAKNNVLEKNKEYDIQHRIVLPDGSVKWVRETGDILRDIGGNAVRMVGIVQDINAQKDAEEKLLDSERLFSSVFYNAPVLMSINSFENYTFEEVNNNFISLSGYSREETIGKMPTEIGLISEESRDILEKKVRESGRVTDMEYDLIKADGTIMNCLYSGEILDIRGEKKLLSIAADITELKRMQNALRESEEKYRKYIENAPEGIFVTDRIGRYIDINKAACAMTGYSKTEILSLNFKDIISPTSISTFELALVTLKETGSVQTETRILKKDNTERWFSVLSTRLNNNTFITFCLDITDLRISQKRYDILFKEMQNGFAHHEMIFNDDGEAVDYRFLDVNPAFEAMTGLKAENIVGKTVLEVLPDVEPFWLKTYGQVVKTGEGISFSQYARPMDKHFSVSAYRSGENMFACFFTDVTEQKKAEKALKDSEAALNRAQEIGQLGSFTWNLANNEITCSDNMCRIAGVDPEEVQDIMASVLTKMIHPDDSEEIHRQFALMVHEKRTWPLQFRIIRPDGDIRHLETVSRFIFDDNGEPEFCIGVHHDVTDRKKSVEELLKSRSKIQSIFQASPIGIGLVVDRLYQEVNDRFCEMIGYSHDELIGQSARIVYPTGEDFENVGAELSRQIDTWGRGSIETQLLRKDGTVIEVLLSASPLDKNDIEKGMGFTVLDITERKRIEQERITNEKRLKTAEHFAGMGSWEMDVATGKCLWTDELFRICGLEPGSIEPCYDTVISITHPDDQDRTKEAIKNTIKNGIPYNLERRIMRPDGSVRWINSVGEVTYDENGNPLRFAGSFLDITHRKLSEIELQRSEERFRELSDASRDGIIILDKDLILDANKAYCDIFGYELDEIIGKSTLGFTAPESREKVKNVVMKNKEEMYEGVGLRKDGTKIITEVWGRKILYHNRALRIASIRDITNRIKQEQDLRENELRFREMFEHMRSGVAIYEAVDNGNDFIFKNINPAGAQIGNTSRDAHLGKSVEEVYPGVKKMGIFKALQDVWRTGQPQIFPLCSYSDNRINIWVENYLYKLPSGEVIAVYNDLTEQRQAEDALRQSEEKAQGIIKSIADPIIIINKNHVITWMNDRAIEYFGEMEGQTCYSSFYEGQEESCPHCTAFKKKHTGEIQDRELQLKNRHGEIKTFWVSTNVSATDENGMPESIVEILRDITERIKLEEERAQLEENYYQAQKMETIGRLAGGMAHDFNNIIQAMSLYCDLSLASISQNNPLYDSLQEIHKGTLRASDLTGQLLAFSRKQLISPITLNLNTIISNLEKMLKRLIGENIEFLTSLQDNLWNCTVDKGQIEQVITNIVVNARDAIDDNGVIEVSTRNYHFENSTDNWRLTQDNEYVLLTISDNGSGIPDEIISQIFEPFFTTKGLGKGTGLGLSTCYGIVKQNNGEITVWSDMGNGSRFNIYLPKVHSDEETVESTESANFESYTGSETVLLVEDEESVRKVLEALLRKEGYTVLSAENGMSALEIAGRHSSEINLLITDIVMPGMNGKVLSEKMKELYADINILFISGYTDDSIGIESVINENNFLPKPIRAIDLLKKIRHILSESKKN